ncbi:type VI secretion system tip protein VgrG [Atlantibacter subterranea]|uniref:Type VI secretion system tip protein VgrG n=1 Tax=Atlantibacter subterraneus TaxID=255519 RepID=A0A3R9F2R8_9ENTR|nr:type VI secretion system tip protein TssI/VgrG [Atlantibacter subterranea]MDA3132347.1 type VI secretion system tip protein TssI/VgrG [Atlantibacter subterranea]RSB59869.1 type VI secretion system tip protein VgrG [Atlantibacter subterranea]RSE03845.1 type VI secretion system tip protein VgrG [Atlantibacter subterranea]RSE24768.1 type VI secretion system tip protein VgrG [Atlantibacter subterranea]
MAAEGLRFTLKVDGIPEMATAVVSFRLVQRHSVPFVLEAGIASGLFDLTAEDFLEKEAVLTVWQGDVAQRYVSGIVSEVSLGVNNGWQMRYHLRVSPPLWRAGLRENYRIFQQQDIQTISSTLLNENGVTEWLPLFYEAHPAREFCVQYGESDLGFLTRLWAEEGLFFFERCGKEGPEQRLAVCDDVAGLTSAGTLAFNPDTTTGGSTEYISDFHYRARIRPSSVETQDYTFKTPGWPGYYGHDGENLNGQGTQYEIFDYPGRFKDEQHGQDFARYRMEGLRNSAEQAYCVSNSARLWPGVRFQLTDHPSQTLNREWQVVKSTLLGEQPQALHGSQGKGTTLSNQSEVVPADRTWRVPPLPKPSVDGPQSAIVTGPAGEEIFCDEHGRVRVKFRWDRYNPATEASSCWVRVSQAWAGPGFGNLAIPRIGQEVIVDFLNGDPDQPVIMGRTYHEDNRSPGSLPGTKTQMTIRSKTYRGSGFNELKFDDATDKEQVYIHAQKNMDTEVLNDRTTTVKHDHTERITNNQKITVGVGQTVSVGSRKEGGHDQSITVANDRRITVGNDQTVRVKHDRVVNTGHDEGLYVRNDRRVTVEGKQEQSTTGDHISLVKGTHSLEVKGDLARKVSGALGIKVRNEIVLESSGKTTLKVGSSFVVIHAGGVDIAGPKINLNSGGSPGTPVQTLQPAILRALTDENDGVSGAEDAEPPRKNVQNTFNNPPQDLVPPQLRRIFSR